MLSGSVKSARGFLNQQNALLCSVSEHTVSCDSQSDLESVSKCRARRSYAEHDLYESSVQVRTDQNLNGATLQNIWLKPVG